MVLSSADGFALALVALIGLVILRRAVLMMSGAPVSLARLAAFPAFYVLFYALGLLTIAAVAGGRGIESLLGLGADLALVVAGVALGYLWTRAHVQLYRPPGATAWYYRLGPALPVLYVVLFFVRTGLEIGVVGQTPFVFPTAAQIDALSTLAWLTLLTVDAIWGWTTGLLLGRSVGVYRAWRARLSGPSTEGAPAL